MSFTFVPLVILGAVALLLVLLKGPRTLHETLFPRLYERAAFPEDHFRAMDEARFRERVTRGYARMADASVVICGITRNDEATLPLSIARVERTAACFRWCRVVVFENDSTDRTPDILRDWEARNPDVTILSETMGERDPHKEARFDRLGRCRNRYVDWLRRTEEGRSAEFVLVVDFDLGGGWSLDGLASTFAEDGWDAVGSNGIGYHNLRRTYYDVVALRPLSVLGTSLWHRIAGEARTLRRGAPMIPVRSAFGGLGVYRREVFSTRSYAGTFDAVEHLSLNADGRLRFFLNPSQITVVGTQRRSLLEDSRPRWRRALELSLTNW